MASAREAPSSRRFRTRARRTGVVVSGCSSRDRMWAAWFWCASRSPGRSAKIAPASSWSGWGSASAYSLERVVHASARTPGGFVGSGDVDVNSAGPECGDDAAVHEEICSGDECGVGSEEEGGDGWNLVGGADTPGERTGDPPRPPPVGGRSPSLRITPRVHTPHDATTARSSRCRPDPRSRGQSDSHRPSPSCRSVLALVTRMSGSWAKPERLRGALAAGAPLDELCGTSDASHAPGRPIPDQIGCVCEGVRWYVRSPSTQLNSQMRIRRSSGVELLNSSPAGP